MLIWNYLNFGIIWILKAGDSYSIVIPKEIIRKYKWKEKQKLLIEDKGRGLIQLRDWRTKKIFPKARP